jgi:protein TonB
VTAPPGPSASASSHQAESTWEAQLVAHLARFKRFPPAAQRRGEQGVVTMRLTLGRGGAVLSMAIVRGSGYADLDGEAQAWMVRAQPLPPFPPEITAQQMEIVVPLHFTLR